MEIIRRSDQTERWGLILAGGEGTRLKPLTRVIAGDDRPKQFCAFFGGSALIDDCLRRVSLLVREEHTVTIVTRDHEKYYKPISFRDSEVLVQPQNKGTAPAVILGLLRIAQVSHDAIVAIFPLAHYIDNDEVFMSYVESAFTEAQQSGNGVFLLATTSGQIDKQFDRLKDSCIMVGRVDSFLRLAESAQPVLYEHLVRTASSRGTSNESASIDKAYRSAPSADFFDEVIAVSRENVRIKEPVNIGWWNLSEPSQTLMAIQSHLAGIKAFPNPGKADYKTSISFLRMHYEGLAQSHRSVDNEPI